MKKTRFIKAGAVALSILTISGLPTSPFTSSAYAAISIDDKDHDAKGVKIMARSIEVIGGAEKIGSIEFMSQKGTISIPSMGLTGTIETSIASPNKLRVEVDIAMLGKSSQGLNDGVVWTTDAMSGPRILSEEESIALINQTDLSYPLNYLENYTTIEYVEETEFDGQQAHKLRLVSTEGEESFQYYSEKSGFAIGIDAEAPSAMGRVRTVTTLQDYKELGGQMQPTTIIQMIGPTKVLITITSSSAAPIADSVFEMPAAVSALIEVSKEKEEAVENDG